MDAQVRQHKAVGARQAWRETASGAKNPTLTPHQRHEAIKRLNAEKEMLGEIARSYNVSR